MREVTSDRTLAVPTRLILSIGGFHAPHYEVRWQRGRLWYGTDGSKVTITPSAPDWETFWTAMDQIDVWGWQPRYDDQEILDGTEWSIEISDEARSVRSYGSNAYPHPFQRFLKAVERLVRQPFGQVA